jgi:Fe2+ or Zn2+ uptake regulation protein
MFPSCPPDVDRNNHASHEKLDAGTRDLILQFLTQAQEPVSRYQIISHINVGFGTIDRCLKKLADEGIARRIQTRSTTVWEVVK